MSRIATRLNLRKWRWLGAASGLVLLAWVLRDLDPSRFLAILAKAEIWPLLLLPAATVLEQLLRAFKWRQMLYPLRPVGTWRLFGAIMAGYLANLAAPVRVSPLVRAWLIARLEALRTSTLLATVALDRLIDGIVFVAFTALALELVRFPDAGGAIREGLRWGALGSLVVFSGSIAALVAFSRRRRQNRAPGAPPRLIGWLPRRWRDPVRDFVRHFFEGVVWPSEAWRGAAIVTTSIAIKIVAISYFLWAGLAFGVALTPEGYLFLMVFLGFLVILAGTLRIVGGFTAGAVFVLEGLGVEVEKALAMTLIVQAATLSTVAISGAAALWAQGMTLTGAFTPGDGRATAETGSDENGGRDA
jgi:uncharacterized membrane protein YbhN (UPF0104 family)